MKDGIGIQKEQIFPRRFAGAPVASRPEAGILLIPKHPKGRKSGRGILGAAVCGGIIHQNRFERNFGRAALEGMAAGVPVLAIRAGGLPEIVQHGENGFLADSREPDVLAQALTEILDRPEGWPEIVKNGYRTVREKFSGERQVRDIERVILDVCGRTLLVPPPLSSLKEGPLFASAGKSGGEDRNG